MPHSLKIVSEAVQGFKTTIRTSLQGGQKDRIKSAVKSCKVPDCKLMHSFRQKHGASSLPLPFRRAVAKDEFCFPSIDQDLEQTRRRSSRKRSGPVPCPDKHIVFSADRNFNVCHGICHRSSKSVCQKICRSHLIYVLRICRPSALLAEHRPRNQNGIAFSKLEQRKFFIIMFHVDLRTRGSSFCKTGLKYNP